MNEQRHANKTTVAVSGGFDPIHVGHIRYLREAKQLGDYLIVILNTDEFLMKKKGYSFMPFNERLEILKSIKYVDEVFASIDNNMTVARSLKFLKPDIFAKGGDRREDNDMPSDELDTCRKYGIKIVYGVGGFNKQQSSSHLVNKIGKKE